MNENKSRYSITFALVFFLALAGSSYAGKPDIISHDTILLQNSISITVKWQAEEPVVLLKASVGGEIKEIELDEYDDNIRDRYGYHGEASLLIKVDTVSGYADYVPYLIQIRDDLGRKNQISGRVKIDLKKDGTTAREEKADKEFVRKHLPKDSKSKQEKDVVDRVLDIMERHGTIEKRQSGESDTSYDQGEGDYGDQTEGDYGDQTGGDYSDQTGGDYSDQTGGDYGDQTGGDYYDQAGEEELEQSEEKNNDQEAAQ